MTSATPRAPALSPTAAANFFHTPRLILRAVEESDAEFIHAVESDPTDHLFANGGLQKPRNHVQTLKQRDFLMKEALIGVVICVKPDANFTANTKADATNAPAEPAAPIPIGTLSLEHQHGALHRSGFVGISVLRERRGKGYGEEALRWLVQWGFNAAGLHRIEIAHFSWNMDAGRMYRRLGFEEQGRRKECFWFWGGWGDEIILAMTENTWRELEREREKEKGGDSVAIRRS